MQAARLILVLAILTMALPAAAAARFGLAPRLSFATVIEDGPPKTDSTAYGTVFSVGLGVGYSWLSVVADLGFRSASVSKSALEDGWKEYGTDDTTFTLGLRSGVTLLDLVHVAGELHAGRAWADHRAVAVEPVALRASGDDYWVRGGAAEASYLLTKNLSAGLRVGADRFTPIGTDDIEPGRFSTTFERTSYTAGLLLGVRL